MVDLLDPTGKIANVLKASNPEPQKTAEQLEQERLQLEQQQQQQQQQQQAPANVDTPDISKLILEKYPDHKLDDKFNLIDKDGKVIKTVDQLDEEFGEIEIPEEVDEYEDLLQTVGITLVDETNKPIEVEKSVKGVKQYIEQAIPVIESQAITQFLNSIPGLVEIATHLKQGGKIDNFKTQVDFSNFTLEEKNTDQHIEVISAKYQRQGITKDEADKLAKLVAANGKSYDEAKTSLDQIVEFDKVKLQREKQEAETRRQQETAKLRDYYAKRFELIDQGFKTPLGQVKIPVTDVNTFKEFISKPIDRNGNTKLDQAMATLTPEQETLLQLMIFKNFDTKSLITQIAETRNVTRLKALIEASHNATQKSKPTPAGGGVNLEGIKLKDIKFGNS